MDNLIIIFLIIFQGCLDGFEKFLKDHLIIVGGVGIGIAFIQVCYWYLQRFSFLCEVLQELHFVVCGKALIILQC